MKNIERTTLQIEGMTCVGCENKIESTLRKFSGIVRVKANYTTNSVLVAFAEQDITLREIKKAIESLGYKIKNSANIQNKKNESSGNTIDKLLDILTIFLTMYLLYHFAHLFGLLNVFNVFPEAKIGMSYGVLFVIGVLTSVHCVAMCGGINISQCLPKGVSEGSITSNQWMPSFLYNSGRVVSYTIIGGIVGALGSVVSFSGSAKGIVAIVASIFMMIMGINMLNLFPSLRKFNLRMPKFFARMIGKEKAVSKNRPFYIGLLNGLMPCGPLQAMQLYALSTGDPIKGALAMFVFSLGTVPLMFGLGALSSILSKKFTAKMMQVSAVLVIVLGFAMFQTGMTVSGIQLPSFAISDLFQIGDRSIANESVVENGIQTVKSEVYSGRYEPISVRVDVPVKWIIHVGSGQLTGCNNRIIINSLSIQLEEGNNFVEFTPTKTGKISFSCWMGMIRSYINVVS
ncbi:MAG: sulfite exporter TauE/SafE family protein [Erysipelotrichaceae bacterium]|nr:sulfite exporter TauE/SafE family protein [Erysipelotrichaceae bacterium]MDP3304533.1 sulfite exporter TauE/SafE family protein [Erysipelotrichaceae bacterium]